MADQPMPEPRYWNDSALLSFEPFLSRFAVRKDSGSLFRRKDVVAKWCASIAEDLRSQGRARKITSTWARCVATRAFKVSRKIMPPDVDTVDCMEALINFYWAMNVQDISSAQKAVDAVLRKLNIKWSFKVRHLPPPRPGDVLQARVLSRRSNCGTETPPSTSLVVGHHRGAEDTQKDPQLAPSRSIVDPTKPSIAEGSLPVSGQKRTRSASSASSLASSSSSDPSGLKQIQAHDAPEKASRRMAVKKSRKAPKHTSGDAPMRNRRTPKCAANAEAQGTASKNRKPRVKDSHSSRPLQKGRSVADAAPRDHTASMKPPVEAPAGNGAFSPQVVTQKGRNAPSNATNPDRSIESRTAGGSSPSATVPTGKKPTRKRKADIPAEASSRLTIGEASDQKAIASGAQSSPDTIPAPIQSSRDKKKRKRTSESTHGSTSSPGTQTAASIVTASTRCTDGPSAAAGVDVSKSLPGTVKRPDLSKFPESGLSCMARRTSRPNDRSESAKSLSGSVPPMSASVASFFAIPLRVLPIASPSPSGPSTPAQHSASSYQRGGLLTPPETPRHIVTAARSAGPKQKLRSRPPMWARSRQEICETLPWFRSYQAGVYYANDVARGYLLAGKPALRDAYEDDGRIIISHGGGKAESEYGPARDQRTTDKSVRSLLNTWKNRVPIFVLVDDEYQLFPYDLRMEGYAYVTLGWYYITDAWAEREPATDKKGEYIATDVTRWKFKFQWAEDQGEPWWCCEPGQTNSGRTAQEESTRQLKGSASRPQKLKFGAPPSAAREAHTCSTCGGTWPLVFANSPMCLDPSCASFWFNDGGLADINVQLRREFLQPTDTPKNLSLEQASLPSPPTVAQDDIVTSSMFLRGFCCTQCGRLSCRYKWEEWRCSNTMCNHTLDIKARIRHPSEFSSIYERTPQVHTKDGIRSSKKALELDSSLSAETFHLPTSDPTACARVHIIRAKYDRLHEADVAFERYQSHALKGDFFQRWPTKAHKLKGTMLSRYFSHNAGVAYKYVANTQNTVSFEDAPEAVGKALDIIQERACRVLGAPSVAFNEILSVAYMEKQKMSFHTDDESGLGPIVASLSLGGAAQMHFRPRKKQKSALNKQEEPDHEVDGQDNDMEKHHASTVLTLTLGHGDVVVMEGTAVQKEYEHEVRCLDNLRFAATARVIDSARNQGSLHFGKAVSAVDHPT